MHGDLAVIGCLPKKGLYPSTRSQPANRANFFLSFFQRPLSMAQSDRCSSRCCAIKLELRYPELGRQRCREVAFHETGARLRADCARPADYGLIVRRRGNRAVGDEYTPVIEVLRAFPS